MQHRYRPVIIFAFISLLIGCSVFVPAETRYLQSAVDRATADEVRAHLGTPRSASSAATGDMLWLYEIRALEPQSQSAWSASGSWCDEYRLVFDQSGVLRQWTHKSFFHGGELMPAMCNSTLGVKKPAL